MLQGYAVHLNDQESTFDITVYGKIEKLHYALLALQYTAISIIFITLLLRICLRRFGKEIDDKVDRVSTSKGIADFIQAIKKDMSLENYRKNSWEYTIPYLLSLGIFIGWDSAQYHNAEKISKSEWFFFFPIPCIVPIIIGVSFGISILLFIGYCTPIGNYVTDQWNKTEIPKFLKPEKEKPTLADILYLKGTKSCKCRLHDIVNFPILTGLGVFFVFHGSWMLLIFSTYPNLVIIKSLFLLPLFFFIITLLPRSIKGLCNLFIDWCYSFKICKTCKKCKTCSNKHSSIANQSQSSGSQSQPPANQSQLATSLNPSSGSQSQPPANQSQLATSLNPSSGSQSQPPANQSQLATSLNPSSGSQSQPPANQSQLATSLNPSSGSQSQPPANQSQLATSLNPSSGSQSQPPANQSQPSSNPPTYHYKCEDCEICTKCKEKCQEFKPCTECGLCACDRCQRCIHCKQCTLCETCKKCKDCTQCFSCKLSNLFKLCINCMKERQNSSKNLTTIYGFSATLAFAIPLLFVLYYGSDYILVVTNLNEHPLELLITLAVIFGVPYYLILFWDNDISKKKKASNDKKTTENNGTTQTNANNGAQQPPANNGATQPTP